MPFYWLRKLVRSNTNPIPETNAVIWKRRLSLMYGFVAFNAFGLVLFSCIKGKADWAQYYGLKTEEEAAVSPGKQWVNTLGIKNAKVYRVSGFSVTDITDDKEKAESKNATADKELLAE